MYLALLPQHWALYANVDSAPTFVYTRTHTHRHAHTHIYIYVSLSVCLSECLFVSFYLAISLFYLSIYQPIYLSIYLSIYLPIYLAINLSIYLSVYFYLNKWYSWMICLWFYVKCYLKIMDRKFCCRKCFWIREKEFALWTWIDEKA